MSNDELTWEEYEDELKELAQQRKTVIFNHKGRDLKFVIRQLKQRQYDKARGLISMTAARGKGNTKIPLKMGEFNRALIKYGVVHGPKGFSARNRAHVEALPIAIRDELASCIEEFTELPEVVKVSFRDKRAKRKKLPADAQ